MGQSLSLHIGLNGVDASQYNGWPGTLAGCVNDANAMYSIASSQGFTPTQLLNNAATADAILTEIGKAAHALESGDTFLLTYSGHGGRVPDPTGESPDGLDDTWVAYDRQLLGHELYNLWSQFASDVRIEVYSDSCHSGTVIRDLVLGTSPMSGVRSAPPDGDVGMAAFKTVFEAAPQALTRSGPPGVLAAPGNGAQNVARAIPPLLALQLYYQHEREYRARQWSRSRGDITASVILISGCQDNQTSMDGQTNGLFTEKLLAVWNNGSFQGTLPQFHTAIVALMPAEQTPNYFTVGADDSTFTNSRPLTIVGAEAGATAGTTASPTQSIPPAVQGPSSLSRDTADPITFTVSLGSNPYYIFEITSDTKNFGDLSGRTSANFYGSWADPSAQARMTDPAYTLPQSAWDALKGNDVLYYRVGSTTSLTGWDNYLVSVTDADAADLAPSITIEAGSAGKSAPPSGPGINEYSPVSVAAT